MEEIDVKKVAELARLSFTEEEAAALAVEMKKIVAFAAEISEADTDAYSAAEHILKETNVFREDVVCETEDTAALVGQAKTVSDGYVTVPQVVEG